MNKVETSAKKVTSSKYHPDRPCNACILCGKLSVHMTHFAALGDKEREFIEQHTTNLDSQPDSCLCKAHRAEAKRMWANSQYVPKWSSVSPSVGVKQNQCV